ncbi:uncharacterized protein LOC123410791 [Hordeum vulgare subsp. vulgare]|uniref:uncharacterized protein LOC123410791 n=1 Tax=Hordeum vulgare subsp. vulgare TaxID=112509 RepID=UPI001B850073|nr:uncharacterized protein LOC123410791 [Hordeum vulgare subsp. vulgare]KAI4976778.1 hypothetical protein ZWY2020_050385 [Hordeum vulgare]
MPSSSSSSSSLSSYWSSSSSSPSSSSDPDYKIEDEAAGVDLRLPAEETVSVLRTQDDVNAVCKKYDTPEDQYAARPAGDLRASSSPPHGTVCVYAHALEAGMRLPLHRLFADVLTHFNIAPTQLAPNGWRIMAGFLVLCHSAGVPPSLAVFRRFFLLRRKQTIGWYFFQSRRGSGLRFTGLPDSIPGWKSRFFFLYSPTSWPCPVEWGKPSNGSLVDPLLSLEDKASAAKLLSAHGASPVDLRKLLCRSSLAAAMISPSPAPARAPSSSQHSSPEPPAPQPPAPSSPIIPAPQPSSPQPPAQLSPQPPPPPYTRTVSKGMDPAVHVMMKTMLAAKVAGEQASTSASASANKVKIEPGSNVTGSSSLRGKKRNLDEAYGDDGPLSNVLPNTPPPADDSSVPAGVCFPPGRFSRSRTMHHVPSGHDGDTTDWEAARERLQGAIAPQQERVFAASEPSDIAASTYVAILQAANYTSFSLAYALELETEVAALRTQLEKTKAKLAVVETEGEMMKAELAVRRRAQDALDGYECWRGGNAAGRRT